MNDTISGIPTTYAISARPPARQRPSTVDPKVIEDLHDTMRNGQALCFPVDGLSEPEVNRLASRLTGVGRRNGTFSVRTRNTDGQLFAWAVVRSPERPARRKRGAALPLTTTTTTTGSPVR